MSKRTRRFSRVVSSVLISSSILLTSLNSNQSLALSGGRPAKPGELSFVVQLLMMNAFDLWTCTASKIGPQIYLTAAHCVTSIPDGELKPISRLLIARGGRGQKSFVQWGTVVKIDVHPNWFHFISRWPVVNPKDRLLMGSDQAVIRIAETNNLPTAKVDFEPLKRGDILYGAGYGIQQVHPFDTRPVGQLRISEKVLSDFRLFQRTVSLPSPDAVSGKVSQFAPGDSGGPILRRKFSVVDSDQSYSVVGIISYIQYSLYVDPMSGERIGSLPIGKDPSSHFVRLDSPITRNANSGTWLKDLLISQN